MNKLDFIQVLLDEASRSGHTLGTVVLELMEAHNESLPKPLVEKNKIKAAANSMILAALDKHGGNQRRAAFELGMSKSTLHDWLKRIYVERTDSKGESK